MNANLSLNSKSIRPNRARLGVFVGLLSVLLLSMAGTANADFWNWGKGKRIKGSGTLATESRDLKDFNGIHTSGSTDIDITIGESFSVEVEADDNLLELLETEVRHGTLYVSFAEGYSINSRHNSRLTITMPSLEELDIRGSSDVRAEGLDGEELILSIAGSGDVTLVGEMKIFEVDIRGSGDVDARKLLTKEAHVSIKGSGDVDVAVEDYINARISGSGDITYYGDPRVKKRVHGSGDINHRRHR